MSLCNMTTRILLIAAVCLYNLAAMGAILPEDRTDALYHSYDGGGVQINGPSILVLKSIGDSISVSGNYYIDSITSASIDVVTTASEYEEKRTEKTAGLTYLRKKTTMSLAYTNSEENDFSANSAHFSFSQDVFGDLTTISMGYSRGWDDVMKISDTSFSEKADRQNYRLGVSQILTKNSILNFNWETITDEGFLNNPYRTVRFEDSNNAKGYSYQLELYPNTRTSNAASMQLKYYLPYNAAVHGLYRYFNDSWGISAHTSEIGYTHPLKKDWTLDIKYRYYTQGPADFYSDLFPFQSSQNFLARDKELSSFNNHTLGLGVSYEFLQSNRGLIKKASANLSYNYIYFNYDNFRDLTKTGSVGNEPLYSFSANVVQLFLSVWY